MEELYAELLLLYIGFHTADRYTTLLDKEYLRGSHNELCFDLECHSSDLFSCLGRFTKYWDHECTDFNCDLFGARLFAGLKDAYEAHLFEISDFGKRCYKLWHMLPCSIGQIEPFHTLSYADDPLSWADEAQTRALYERAFSYYT